jgi:hypothetical protein
MYGYETMFPMPVRSETSVRFKEVWMDICADSGFLSGVKMRRWVNNLLKNDVLTIDAWN